jgi:hypothetical protein
VVKLEPAELIELSEYWGHRLPSAVVPWSSRRRASSILV